MAAPTCDIIFAGGGTAACVTAGRLAAAHPSLKILLVEAGPHTRDLQEHVQPARYMSNLFPGSKVFTFHAAQPSEHVGGRSIVVPVGKCVGGGSSVNFAMYTRAVASDYDDWERVYGNTGWGSKDMIPLLNKAETFQISDGTHDAHGRTGPIKVSYGGLFTNTAEDFLATAAGFDETRDLTKDVNSFHQCNAYGKWPKCDTDSKWVRGAD
ncbi:hypothetical protein HGRIS_003974 [Hohenbuehelia grisea]|uniref:Glucose-methanol-choline oxidoreductase N-terminal domain-containing protein n=1 Tax=Hohenbuehelia grisea TaxID=104357 RepID=A0ABR3JHJ9_9AGAR